MDPRLGHDCDKPGAGGRVQKQTDGFICVCDDLNLIIKIKFEANAAALVFHAAFQLLEILRAEIREPFVEQSNKRLRNKVGTANMCLSRATIRVCSKLRHVTRAATTFRQRESEIFVR